MRRVLVVLAWVFGAYFVGRAVAEPFVIDVADPSSYQDDWGGPSLAGVLAVHAGPGVVAAALMIWHFVRLRRRSRRPSPGAG